MPATDALDLVSPCKPWDALNIHQSQSEEYGQDNLRVQLHCL